jgi:hypothetical protein
MQAVRLSDGGSGPFFKETVSRESLKHKFSTTFVCDHIWFETIFCYTNKDKTIRTILPPVFLFYFLAVQGKFGNDRLSFNDVHTNKQRRGKVASIYLLFLFIFIFFWWGGGGGEGDTKAAL